MLKHIESSRSWNERSLGAKGFTLIELLVVIVILGVLGAVVVFSVRGVATDAQTNSCRTERRTLSTAIEAYYSKYGTDAGSLATLEASGLIRDTSTEGYTVGAGGTITGTCPSP